MLMDSLGNFWTAVRGLPLKCQIAAIFTCILLIFLAIALPLLVTPNYSFDEVTEDCGPEMSMESRKLLLYWHNWYRSIVAKGEYKIAKKNSKLKMLPPATRMLQLKYNCSLEKSSLEWARTVKCQLVHSETNFGENLYICFAKIPHEEASNNATKPWADEITALGMSDLSDWGGGKGHASQVLWETTESVGCGSIHCEDPATMVVCHYYPAGNRVSRGTRKPMYKAGDTLSDCGKEGRKEVPFRKTGLCILL